MPFRGPFLGRRTAALHLDLTAQLLALLLEGEIGSGQLGFAAQALEHALFAGRLRVVLHLHSDYLRRVRRLLHLAGGQVRPG